MQYLILIFFAFITAIFQSSFAYFFNIKGASLNLVLIIALYYLTKNQYLKAIIFALAGGLILDFFSFSKFGNHLIVLLLAIFIISLFSKFFPLEKIIFKTLFILFSLLLNIFIFNIINYIFEKRLFLSLTFVSIEIIYNFIGSLIIFYLFDIMRRRKFFPINLIT